MKIALDAERIWPNLNEICESLRAGFSTKTTFVRTARSNRTLADLQPQAMSYRLFFCWKLRKSIYFVVVVVVERIVLDNTSRKGPVNAGSVTRLKPIVWNEQQIWRLSDCFAPDHQNGSKKNCMHLCCHAGQKVDIGHALQHLLGLRSSHSA